ncbi:MAG TPA: hypothetical protein VK116_12935 [Planctomycetota bacterium]|nr:hypothetical protein [Planctomycetota bacterium]
MDREPRHLVDRSHAWIDARSLELARATAAKIRMEPALFEKARRNIERWRSRGVTSPDLDACDRILERHTFDEVLDLLVEDSEAGRRRRQSSPFVGILPESERREIFRRYEAIGSRAYPASRERDHPSE